MKRQRRAERSRQPGRGQREPRVKRVRADAGDELVKALTELEAEAFGRSGLFNAWLLVPVIRHGAVYALLEGAEPVGVMELLRDWREPAAAYLFGICIRADRRGRGYGRRFLEEVLERIREDGIRRVELTVDPANDAARHLYRERLGFQESGYVEDAYGAGEDRVLMERLL